MSDSDLSDVEWPEMPVDPIENDVTATTSAVDADDETAPPKNKLKLKRKRLKTIDASEIGKSKKKKKKKKDKKSDKDGDDKKSTKNPDGVPYTVSIALPGSIIANAQSRELRTYLAGQIARAATIFNVDEIIVFSETGESSEIEGRFKSGKDSNPDVFLARLLQYLETPQYMRKALFPVHSDLKYAGLLNPLDAPHHLRANEDSLYREGIVVDQTVKEGRGSYCNIGLKKPCSIQRLLKPGVRVTVQLDQPEGSSTQRGLLTGKAVAPSAPRKKKGIWWGYNTRLAGGLGEVFSNCPYKGGYDLCIGTSDKGANAQDPAFKLRPFKHLLIVFGGVLGLETCVEGDEHLEATRPEQLFHQYINVCPRQGSRTIRTEEAIQITLSVLDPYILASGK